MGNCMFGNFFPRRQGAALRAATSCTVGPTAKACVGSQPWAWGMLMLLLLPPSPFPCHGCSSWRVRSDTSQKMTATKSVPFPDEVAGGGLVGRATQGLCDPSDRGSRSFPQEAQDQRRMSGRAASSWLRGAKGTCGSLRRSFCHIEKPRVSIPVSCDLSPIGDSCPEAVSHWPRCPLVVSDVHRATLSLWRRRCGGVPGRDSGNNSGTRLN